MEIIELTLFCQDIPRQRDFFNDILDLNLVSETETSVTYQIGHTKLTFEYAETSFVYHYCFLIPSNKLEEALTWLNQRTTVIEKAKAKYIYHFESWNAHSIYFYDGVGNIAEFIVRHDLNNSSNDPFDISQVISINEIGAPTSKIKKMNQILESEINSFFWKGNFERFVTNGDQDGLFLLVNNEIKKAWYPVNLITQSSPFIARIKSQNIVYNIDFFSVPRILKINDKNFEL